MPQPFNEHGFAYPTHFYIYKNGDPPPLIFSVHYHSVLYDQSLSINHLSVTVGLPFVFKLLRPTERILFTSFSVPRILIADARTFQALAAILD